MRKAAAASKTLPLDAVLSGAENYKRFDDAIDETMQEIGYDNAIGEDETIRKKVRDSSESDIVNVDTGELSKPSELTESSHMEVSFNDENYVSPERDSKEERFPTITQNGKTSPPLVPQDSGTHSASSDSTIERDSPKSSHESIPAGSEAPSENVDINNSSKLTHRVPTETLTNVQAGKHKSVINVRF